MGKVDEELLVEGLQQVWGEMLQMRLGEAVKLYEDMGRELSKETLWPPEDFCK